MMVEPVRTKPADVPVSVPPLLLKSTVPANAAMGNAKASRATKPIRFIHFSSELKLLRVH
jgi:hypothetical protein